MNQSSCKDVQIDLLQGRSHADHFATCADCRAFAAAMDVADRTLPDFGEPSAAIDQAILTYAGTAARRQAPRKKPQLLFFALAAAAALIVGFAIWPDAESGVEPASEFVKGPGTITSPQDPLPKQPSTMVAAVEDSELTGMLTAIADDDYSGSHIDDELLTLELQLAALSTDTY